MARIEQKQNDWLGPFQNWIKDAQNLNGIARDADLLQKKVSAKEIFGSNLHLASRAVRGEPVFPYLSALRAAESVGQKSESLILVPRVGVEPTSLSGVDFKSTVYPIPPPRHKHEGLEGNRTPVKGFADPCLSHSTTRPDAT